VPAVGAAVRTPRTRAAAGAPVDAPVPVVDAQGAPAPDPDVGNDPVPADLARVLAALSTPAIWVDPTDTVVWVHPALEALRVVRRGGINTPEIARMVQRSRASDQPSARDLTVRRPGRRQAGVRLRVRVAPMADGSALVLVDDITEAERLDHARRDFVANVSHELKTPIGALALLAEAVHEAQDDPEAVERFTTRMLGETRRLTSLLNDLMDLSRLEGVEPLQPMEPVDVDEVVAQACDDARSLAQDKDIAFLRGGVSGLRVEGVPVQLATAVRNLIVNAINYSPPATKVAVTTGTLDGSVTIAVTDQGIGIPPTELDRIFERFYRVDPARSRDTGGTGLGLSIVKHVCANHGGDCDVWSKVGEGSTFTIRLPALSEKAAKKASARTSRPRASTTKEDQ
jgi:two-component system, OmpR family, sensor histidine kinase SenX3